MAREEIWATRQEIGGAQPRNGGVPKQGMGGAQTRNGGCPAKEWGVPSQGMGGAQPRNGGCPAKEWGGAQTRNGGCPAKEWGVPNQGMGGAQPRNGGCPAKEWGGAQTRNGGCPTKEWGVPNQGMGGAQPRDCTLGPPYGPPSPLPAPPPAALRRAVGCREMALLEMSGNARHLASRSRVPHQSVPQLPQRPLLERSDPQTALTPGTGSAGVTLKVGPARGSCGSKRALTYRARR